MQRKLHTHHRTMLFGYIVYYGFMWLSVSENGNHADLKGQREVAGDECKQLTSLC